MEQFEKLWEESDGGTCGKQACAKYWQEALKWVRREQRRLFPHHEDWQGNFIERELGNEQDKEN